MTRVKGLDIDDWRKLRHVIEYLRVTHDLPLILGADGSGVLSWYVDALFADDWRKLRHVIEYLRVTHDLPLTLGADGSGVLSWYVDALFAVHPDMRGHPGGVMTMGRGYPLDSSSKHKLNSRNSAESEIIAVDNLILLILWTDCL
jgi:hypothetical protein